MNLSIAEQLPGRVAVNAALEKLIVARDGSGEAARTVIAYARQLKMSGRLQIDGGVGKKSAGRGSARRMERSYGIHKDHIGRYRLWKEREGLVTFHTQGVDGKSPDRYQLVYDPETLEPALLGIERERVVFTLWLLVKIRFTRRDLQLVHSYQNL